MSNEGQHNPATPAEPAAADSGASSGGMSKIGLIVGCLVLATTVAECVAAFLYLPIAVPPAAVALDEEMAEEESEPAHGKAGDGHHGAEKGKDKHKDDKAGGDSKHKAKHGEDDKLTEGEAKLMAGLAHKLLGDCQEMDLGEFRVTAYQPVSNTTLRLDFHIYGAVFNSQVDEFTSVFNAKKQRLRDQVITMVRTVDMADFTEAGLGLIKRRILETTNKTFGKPYLQAVIFSEFSFVEQ